MRSNKIKLKRSEIAEKITVCPYCMEERSFDDWKGCCGESNSHYQSAYLTINDECYLEDEVIIIRE